MNMKSTSPQITSVQNCFTVLPRIGPLQITGSVSFSRRRLIDIISIPVLLFKGYKPNSLPVALSFMPNAFGIEGPVTSASSIATLYPILFIVTASMEVTDDLPTPPLPLTTPITFLMLLSSCGFSLKSVFASFLSVQSSSQLLQL